jgi:hypothetical protein
VRHPVNDGRSAGDSARGGDCARPGSPTPEGQRNREGPEHKAAVAKGLTESLLDRRPTSYLAVVGDHTQSGQRDQETERSRRHRRDTATRPRIVVHVLAHAVSIDPRPRLLIATHRVKGARVQRLSGERDESWGEALGLTEVPPAATVAALDGCGA